MTSPLTATLTMFSIQVGFPVAGILVADKIFKHQKTRKFRYGFAITSFAFGGWYLSNYFTQKYLENVEITLDAETFNGDSHTDSFMAEMPQYAEKYGDGWYIPAVHRDKKQIKEIFKNWKPSEYPYEKRITQDSLNEGCNSCGKENVHYQFYLPQKNSVNPKMRFVFGATHCQYDTNTCGGNICRDCADDASCENCGAEICSSCEEENNYDYSDLVCVDCREFAESLED